MKIKEFQSSEILKDSKISKTKTQEADTLIESFLKMKFEDYRPKINSPWNLNIGVFGPIIMDFHPAMIELRGKCWKCNKISKVSGSMLKNPDLPENMYLF